MESKRIRMGHPHGQTPPNVFSDFDWIHRNKKELLAKYGECSIIVFNQEVIGAGPTYKEALENAEANLSPDVIEITPAHDWLGYPNPIQRMSIKEAMRAWYRSSHDGSTG